ncbi:MAG: TauD/TfdA family dioxygenase, partial [Nitrospirota bacterium]|nr:TauD/TfdA family dioxygenase [Nitrospirota bacterium]
MAGLPFWREAILTPKMGRPPMEIRPLASGLGAEILGVDLAGPLGDDTVRTLRTALLDHVVVFFREQMLTPQERISVAQC